MNTRRGNKDHIAFEISPKLEILFEDKLSTERCRRDARGATFVILFPERSSLSKFMHSPMHPRSCVPVRHAFYYKKKIKKNTDILEGLNSDILIKSYQVLSIWGTVLTPNQILLYGTWAAPQLSCHSLHLKESREIRPEQHKAHSLFYS